ncbi:hypothetical protein SAMN04487818_112145 [Actinokineospora terrae]|uniref:Uncharacterized protein n=1 Tax=Actinokineospora terrae TaxID=155974 RepID=A0A1H9X1R1_9PSEU|nr:hypothetical protein SAMN04487818_112145 [Actinokineospora terrae]
MVETLLGGYDGSSSWSVVLPGLRGSDEQQMVEFHEGLHHELQVTSPYGLVTALAASLARRGFRVNGLSELFIDLVQESTQVHETFATALSTELVGEARARELLAGNAEYLGHLDRAHALVAAGEGGREVRRHVGATARAAVLRAVMAPRGVIEVVEQGFGRVDCDSIVESWTPDWRLTAFERHHDREAWLGLLTSLGEEFADDPADSAVAVQEEVLWRCYAFVTNTLDAAGSPTIGKGEQVGFAEALRDAVGAVDEELAGRLNIVVERRPVLDDALDYDRQRLRLRERLPAASVEPDVTLGVLKLFHNKGLNDSVHVCGVWLSRRVADKQFDFAPGTRLPELLAALMTPIRFGGEETLLFGSLPAGASPREAQRLLGEASLLVLTTHLTLRDPECLALLRTVAPVFVLMDLPIAWHVEDWLRQGAAVSMCLVPLDGIEDLDLQVLVIGIDRFPGMRFVHVGAQIGSTLLIDRLRGLHGDRLAIDPELVRGHGVALNHVLSHVLGAWHVLDQDGVE